MNSFDVFNTNELGLLSIEYSQAEHIKGNAFFFHLLRYMRWIGWLLSEAILSVNKREIYITSYRLGNIVSGPPSPPLPTEMEKGNRSQVNPMRCGSAVYEPVVASTRNDEGE